MTDRDHDYTLDEAADSQCDGCGERFHFDELGQCDDHGEPIYLCPDCYDDWLDRGPDRAAAREARARADHEDHLHDQGGDPYP